MTDKQDREAAAKLQVARAERFKSLWENDGLKDWYETVRRQIIERLLDTTIDQDLERFRLQVSVKQLDAIKGQFMAAMDTGKLARKDLEMLASGKRPFF